METLSKQQTFEVVTRHLLKQGKKSETFTVDAKGEKIWDSAYRGRMRRQCSIGILIPIERYYPGLEGKEVRTSAEVQAAIGDEYHKDFEFLHKLQVVHDFRPEKDWAESLYFLAEKEGVTYPQDLYHLLPKED